MNEKTPKILSLAEIKSINDRILSTGVAFAHSTVTNQKAFYDLRAEIYDAQNEIPSKAKRRETINEIYHSILKNFFTQKELVYLDFGCGTGTSTNQFLAGLKQYSSVATGLAIDISSEMVKLAKAKLPEFKVMEGTVAEINFNGRVDLVTSFFHVLCHLSEGELNQFFKNVSKSLKRGGVVCFEVIKQFDVGERGYTQEDKKEGRKYLAYHSDKKDGSKVSDIDGQPIIGTVRMFTKEEILDFATQSGLKVVDIKEVSVANPDTRRELKEYAVILRRN